MLAEILKRLAEMFPRQDYQSRLERYISSQRILNALYEIGISIGQARAAAALARAGMYQEVRNLYSK